MTNTDLKAWNPRDLLEAVAMDIGKEVAHHIETMYPAAVEAASSTFLLSVRNCVHNEIMAAMESDMDVLKRLDSRKQFRKWIRSQVYKKIRTKKLAEGQPGAAEEEV